LPLLEHLPEAMRPRVRRVLDEAYGLADSALAKRRLLQLAAGLDRTHPGAAASLREGLDETLTLQRPRRHRGAVPHAAEHG
jgi:putative transposase